MGTKYPIFFELSTYASECLCVSVNHDYVCSRIVLIEGLSWRFVNLILFVLFHFNHVKFSCIHKVLLEFVENASVIQFYCLLFQCTITPHCRCCTSCQRIIFFTFLFTALWYFVKFCHESYDRVARTHISLENSMCSFTSCCCLDKWVEMVFEVDRHKSSSVLPNYSKLLYVLHFVMFKHLCPQLLKFLYGFWI